MTIQTVHPGPDTLTIRYLPALVWLFVLLVGYGVVTIGYELVAGLRPVGLGPLLAIMLLALLGGLAAFVGGALVICTFDQRQDRLQIRRFGLSGVERIERKLSEVTAIEIEVLRRSQHRIGLRLRSGERVYLTPYYLVSPFGMHGISRLSALLNLEPKLMQHSPKIWR